MQFPKQVRVYRGRMVTPNAVLVIEDPLPINMGRGKIFMSKDEGATYGELYLGGITGTRRNHFLTVIGVETGMKPTEFTREGSNVAFGGYLLSAVDELPLSDYDVQPLTDEQMDIVRKYESGELKRED